MIRRLQGIILIHLWTVLVNVEGLANIDMFQGDSQELIFDYIVESCDAQSSDHFDPAFLSAQSVLKSLKTGREIFDDFCWEGVTVEYDVTSVGCLPQLTSSELSAVNQVFLNGYSDGTVAVLSSCQSALKFKEIIASNWSSMTSRILMVLPEMCPEVDEHFKNIGPIASTYINAVVSNQQVLLSTVLTSAQEVNEQFMTVIYDNVEELMMFETRNMAKKLFDIGVEVQMIQFDKFIADDKFFNKWLTPVSTATIVIMCNQENSVSVIQRAVQDGVLNSTKLSWLVYNIENVEEIQMAVSEVIRYDTRLLVIRNNKFPDSINMTMLTLQVLQKRFGTYGMVPQKCLSCEEDRVVRSRSLRIVYSSVPGLNSRLQCCALWDLSMTMVSDSDDPSVWGAKYPAMLGIKLILSSLHSPPFIIRKNTGNGTVYTGFLVDIINTLISHLQFSYEIIEPKDRSYGLANNGTFNGIVGQVQRKEADLGLAQMSYLVERTKAVDYLTSYIGYKGLKLVYKNPEIAKLNYNADWITSFTDPFQTSVWMFIVLTVVAAAVSMTTCESFQQNKLYAKRNPRIIEFKNPFNNLFYMYSALLNQGWDMTPEAISSRVVMICFRFFCVFMYAGYSAVIVSQNVVARDTAPFNTLEDILSGGGYKLGTLRNTNFEKVLRTSDYGLYKKTWDYISKHPNNMVSTAKEGFNKVENENYVFMHDEDEVDYELTRSCTFKAPNETPLQGVTTFIAQKNSSYSAAISSLMTLMHETGIIQRLRMKWWKPQKTDACDYLREGQGGAATQKGVTLGTLRMPFVLMLAGIAIAFVLLCVEYQVKKICPALLDISS